MASQHFSRSSGLSRSALRAQALLNRYPDISEQEVAILVRTFAQLPLLDFGLMAADGQLEHKLDAFYRDHTDKLRPRVGGLMWVLTSVAIVVAVLWLASA